MEAWESRFIMAVFHILPKLKCGRIDIGRQECPCVSEAGLKELLASASVPPGGVGGSVGGWRQKLYGTAFAVTTAFLAARM